MLSVSVRLVTGRDHVTPFLGRFDNNTTAIKRHHHHWETMPRALRLTAAASARVVSSVLAEQLADGLSINRCWFLTFQTRCLMHWRRWCCQVPRPALSQYRLTATHRRNHTSPGLFVLA
ncbi:hypothetical protein KIF59_20980 [Enterobacter cloacae subsp. cloacae]|nr:hypothetical protein [Enterobacter cloacae subsp. cloacae]